MDLFASGPVTVVSDVEGGVRCWPAFATPEEAGTWFETLATGATWRQEQRSMYDRIVAVPRLLAHYRLHELPPALPLNAMLERVRRIVPAPYNAVGLNFYRDGNDSVAMHNDKLHTIIAGQPIALVSLGSTRRMRIRSKLAASRSIALDLEPGSLLVMSHASQLTHEHGIPKTTATVGPRMSVVFRVRPEGHSGY